MKYIIYTFVLLITLLISSCSQVEKSDTNVVKTDSGDTQSVTVSEPQPQPSESGSANY